MNRNMARINLLIDWTDTSLRCSTKITWTLNTSEKSYFLSTLKCSKRLKGSAEALLKFHNTSSCYSYLYCRKKKRCSSYGNCRGIQGASSTHFLYYSIFHPTIMVVLFKKKFCFATATAVFSIVPVRFISDHCNPAFTHLHVWMVWFWE